MSQLKSHPSRWQRRPTWPTLRFADGQTEIVIAVGDPWTFELPVTGKNRTAPVKHLVNVVKLKEVGRADVLACYVWEISDRVYQSIAFDPTAVWFKVTRHGATKKNTYYEIEPQRPPTENDRLSIEKKRPIDLELVAIETKARIQRHQRSRQPHR